MDQKSLFEPHCHTHKWHLWQKRHIFLSFWEWEEFHAFFHSIRTSFWISWEIRWIQNKGYSVIVRYWFLTFSYTEKSVVTEHLKIQSKADPLARLWPCSLIKDNTRKCKRKRKSVWVWNFKHYAQNRRAKWKKIYTLGQKANGFGWGLTPITQNMD